MEPAVLMQRANIGLEIWCYSSLKFHVRKYVQVFYEYFEMAPNWSIPPQMFDSFCYTA